MDIDYEKAVQGNADGLCGLYAIVNFLVWKGEVVGDKNTRARHEAFRYTAEAAERLGLFSAQKLYAGFEWPDIVAIFNEYARRNYFGWSAVPLRRLCAGLSNPTNSSLFSKILGEHGAAIVAVDQGRHWVLLYAQNAAGAFDVIDPAPNNPRVTLKKAWSLEDGVALLPLGSKLLEND